MAKLDLLVWVGDSAYPSINSFINETKQLGACRRVNTIPKFIEARKSRVFLIHDNKSKPVIFAYYTVNRIECITKGVVVFSSNLLNKGVVAVDYQDVIRNESERLCGSRYNIGAIYLVSYTQPHSTFIKQDLTKRKAVLGNIVVLKPSIPYKEKQFRNYKYISGDVLLKKKNVEESLLVADKAIEKMKKNGKR